MWSAVVSMGAWVAVLKEDGSTNVILTSLPDGLSRSKEQKWVMKKNPSTKEIVWVGEDGEIMFSQPAQDEVMTFEERQLPHQFGTI